MNTNLSHYVMVLTEPDRLEIVRRYREDGETLTSGIVKVLPPWSKRTAENIRIEDDIFSANCRVSFDAEYTNL